MPPNSEVISRRDFCWGLVVGGVAGILISKGADKVYPFINQLFNSEQLTPLSHQEILSEWKLAMEGPDSYLAYLRNRPTLVRYGGSFSPEQWDWAGYRSISHEKAITSLSEWGVREIRYGFRWQNTETEQGQINLDYYKPSFDALLNQDSSICLGVGIKTFRWPEAHVPGFYQRLIPQDKRVTPGSELAKVSLDYLRRLFEYLAKHYSQSQLNQITCINPENEAISPVAGDPALVITPEYLYDVYQVVREYFPSTPLLFNTAGNKSPAFGKGLTLDTLVDFMSSLHDANLRLGFDFYYKHPDSPVLGQLPQPYDFIAEQEDASQSKSDYFPNLVSRLQQQGIPLEITELQTEPWGDSIKTPGHSETEFIYASRRALNHLFVPQNEALLRVWGLEYLVGDTLAGKADVEQAKILQLIQSANVI